MTPIYRSEEGERAVQDRYRLFLKYWPAANQQLRVPTREGETFIVACGDENAPPLLLLHGSGGNAAMWMGDVAIWAQRFRVYAVDVIGEPGLSAPSRPPLGVRSLRALAGRCHAGPLPHRVSIVGVSLGGWLALDYATRRPESVESLVFFFLGGRSAPPLFRKKTPTPHTSPPPPKKKKKHSHRLSTLI